MLLVLWSAGGSCEKIGEKGRWGEGGSCRTQMVLVGVVFFESTKELNIKNLERGRRNDGENGDFWMGLSIGGEDGEEVDFWIWGFREY